MGEECALPGRTVFQRMLLVSLQWTGGFARGATPVANGPRHCGQLSGTAALALTPASSAGADGVGRQARTRIRRNAHVMLIHCVPLMWSRRNACTSICMRAPKHARNSRPHPGRVARGKYPQDPRGHHSELPAADPDDHSMGDLDKILASFALTREDILDAGPAAEDKIATGFGISRKKCQCTLLQRRSKGARVTARKIFFQSPNLKNFGWT